MSFETCRECGHGIAAHDSIKSALAPNCAAPMDTPCACPGYRVDQIELVNAIRDLKATRADINSTLYELRKRVWELEPPVTVERRR